VLHNAALADDVRFATNAERLKHRVELESMIEHRLRVFPRAQVTRGSRPPIYPRAM